MKKNVAIKKAISIGMMLMLFIGMSNTMANAQDNGIKCSLLPATKGRKVVLTFRNLEGEEVIYRVRDTRGYVFITKTVEDKDNFAKVLNLSDLPEGEYVFSYTVNGVEKSSRFYAGKEEVTITSPTKLQGFFTPFYCKVEGKSLNVFADNEANETLKVRIYNRESGAMVFARSFNADEDYVKKLDLAGLESGDYEVKVIKGKSVIKEEFSL